MKKITQLLACATLVAALMPQLASAVLFTNQVQNIQARNVRATLAAGTGVATGEIYNQTAGAIRNQYTVALGGQTGKAWVQFDLASTWALYGQSNFIHGDLWLWNQNSVNRQFWTAGIADGAGLEGWDCTTMTWSNAPANQLSNTNTIGYAWDYSKCYGGTNLWQNDISNPAQGIDVSTPSVSQGALYISTNSTSKVTQFLQSDTDGKVTIGISDGPYNSNQTVPIGTNGVYAADPLAPNGLPTRSSPTLTLIFNIRVALTGGGLNCPGGPGVDVSMAGTDVGVDYYLTTNGVPTGQFVVGNGTNVSFGLQTTVGSYGAIASNTVTTVTTPVLSYVTVNTPPLPGVAVQPTPFVAATNSIASFTLVATNDGGGYAWYKAGTPLTDDGHYSQTHTAQLLINPVLAGDAGNYYCVVSNACGYFTYSTTNALTIQAANNLVWQGTPTNTWNIATTANWTNSAGAAVVFNQGDNVTLDDTAISLGLFLSSPILAPGTITFNHSALMGIGAVSGIGNIAGSASKLIVNGITSSSHLVISNANSFAGGTTLNDGWLTLNNINSAGPGTSTITLAGTGFSLLEVNQGGNTSGGSSGTLPGLTVTANSIVQFNAGGTAAGSIYGPITGPAGTNLTLRRTTGVTSDRIRIWHTNFTCNLNIVFDLASANLSPYNPSGTQIYNGVISGTGVIETRQGGRVILNGANTYNGGVLLDGGTTGAGNDAAFGSGSISIVGGGGLYASGGDRTIANQVFYTGSGGTLTFTDTNILTISGSFDLGSGGLGSAVNRTISVSTGSKGVISGVIGDSSFPGCGVTKTGNGTLYLNGGNTYAGPTTNTAGVLAGTGSITGSAVVTGGGVGGGTATSMGTFSIGGNLMLAGGGGFFRVNRSGSASDHVAVTGSIVNTGAGTITITNVGAALEVGDTFMPFNGASVSGGSALNITGAGVTWTNKLATGGGIQVLSITPPIANYSTNITYSISGSTLTVGWPTTHLGWVLQAQTNNLSVGLKTTWATIPGTGSVTSTNLPIDPLNPTVFYRLSTP